MVVRIQEFFNIFDGFFGRFERLWYVVRKSQEVTKLIQLELPYVDVSLMTLDINQTYGVGIVLILADVEYTA